MDIKIRIKICCISSIEEAKTAIAFGASALGLVANMPSGPGVISDALISQIAKTIPPPIASFLLTSETSAAGIIAHHRRTRTNTIQLVDELADGNYAMLRQAMPAIKLVQVIHVIDEGSIDKAIRIAEDVDAILLDSGNPNLAIKELGGTGKVHNWTLSRKIVEAVKIPVFLAGGLNAGNIRNAIDAVQPFGVDLCGGVRSNGLLDEKKLDRFMNALFNYC